MLMPGTNNAKLGGYVTAGKWQGSAMYSLTLPERTTCPTTCQQWDNCYGNNMPFAHRFDPDGPDFYNLLEQQLTKLDKKHAGEGYVVRLHVLGDFFSLKYVSWWVQRLRFPPELKLFGYTHPPFRSPIGQVIYSLNLTQPDRWQIRFSDDLNAPLSAVVTKDKDYVAIKGSEVVCPEQRNQTPSCAACGLCWSAPLRRIVFVEH